LAISTMPEKPYTARVTLPTAERVIVNDGRQYHIAAAPGDVANCVLLVGDPDRAERAADRFESVRFRSSHRDYRIYTGVHEGLELSVMCVGMGAGCMEIAVVELCQIVDRPILIRAGSSGAIDPQIELGELIITQGALRMESASLGFVEPGYPAFAHAEAQLALIRAAEEHALRYHVGVTATAAGFYGAQGRNAPGFPALDPNLLARLTRQGVKNLEMETSCLLTLAALKGVRAGAVCVAFGTRYANAFLDDEGRRRAESDVVSVGLTSLHHLARMRDETGAGVHWHDGLLKR
jgi:uridine phosphorylase